MADLVQPLQAEHVQAGDIQAMTAGYLGAIRSTMVDHPRSQQTNLGPSEIGGECLRRIGYKLLGHAEPERLNLKAQIGTWGHAGLEAAFDTYNLTHPEHGGQERYLIENTVSAGVVPGLGYELTGHCDLYDRVTCTVIDHKFIGPSQLDKYRRSGPSRQYRVQANVYGYGWRRAGFHVSTVAIAFIPRQGEFDQIYLWAEPYSEQTALDALTRLSGLATLTGALGDGALALLTTADQYCFLCPFYQQDSAVLAAGCPGHAGGKANNPRPTPTALTLAGSPAPRTRRTTR